MRQGTQELQSIWKKRVFEELSQEDWQKQQSILRWLLGEDMERLNGFYSDVESINQTIEYRYCILKRHYLDVQSSQAYSHLITRLTSLVMRSSHFRSWLKKNPSYQKVIIKVIQTIIQELLEKEPGLQQTINWIAQCTQDSQLREAFLLASLEEYCCQSIHNQPRLIHCLRHFLWKQSSRNETKNLKSIQSCA